MAKLDRKNAMAPTPPMGWNSWDCYMSAVNESELMANAEYMAEHLSKFGWEYIVCDIQWFEPDAGTESGVEYRPFARLCMDEYGRLIPAPNRFPSSKNGKGFKPIADRIHAMGLKFGIHIMRGIPRQAVYARCRIEGTEITLDKAADPSSICPWNGDMFGALNNEYAKAYYDSLFRFYAQWGVDYVKVDDIAAMGAAESGSYLAPHEVEMIRSAIDCCGRDMVLSLSPGPANVENAWHLKQNANMWRITNDFWDHWPQLKKMFRRCEIWETHVSEGCWPDCDMIPIGRIGVKFGKGRWSNFTYEEQKTMLTLWSIFRSPLMLGGELMSLDDQTIKLITNEDVLRLNKHSYAAKQIERTDERAVWTSKDENGDHFAALFNLSEETRTIALKLDEFSLKRARMKELWIGYERQTTDTVSDEIAPHGCRLYRITALE